jgi:DHA2 family multidrug resistance protein
LWDPTLGPPLGGYIVDNYSWPYIFYINIPLGIIAAMLTLQFVRSPRFSVKKTASEIDWWGIILLAVAVGSLQYVLEKGQEEDWFNDEIITLLTVTTVLGFFFFIWRELTYKNPIVNLSVLSNGNLRVGTILSFIRLRIVRFHIHHSIVYPGYIGLDGDAIGDADGTRGDCDCDDDAGSRSAAATWREATVSRSAGDDILFRLQLLGIPDPLARYRKDAFFNMLIVRGIGLGLLFVPITTLALSTLKGREIGEGAAFTGMMRQLGGSFGVAVITTFIARQNMVHRNDLVSKLDINNPAVQQRVEGLQRTAL